MYGSSTKALNPTGSFKGRGMTMAISKAAEDGAKGCHLRIHRKHIGISRSVRGEGWNAPGTVPDSRRARLQWESLAQAVIHDSTILQVNGNFDDCLTLACELSLRIIQFTC